MEKTLRVLMLEDNPGDAQLNAVQLSDSGLSFMYHRVEKEEDYLRELKEFKPDIILADYQLPKFDGLSALHLAQERYPFIPFIIVSGVLEEETAIKLLREGASDYILKEKIARLGPAVKNAFDMKKIKEDKARAEEELKESFQYLEKRVQDRTRELSKANDALKKEIAERIKFEEALRQSEERWAATLSSIRDAVIATDIEGKITIMNAVAEELTGWSLQEAMQNPAENVFTIFKADTRHKTENPISSVIKKGGTVILSDNTILVRRDGTEIWIDDSCATIQDRDGNTTGVVLVFRDKTERKKLEENVQKLRREYEAFMEHEMKNLVFPMKVYAESLKKSGKENLRPEQKSYLLRIGESAEQAINLIDHLKKMHDIEAGYYEMRIAEQPLSAVIGQVIRELTSPAQKNRVQIDFSPREERSNIPMDIKLMPGVFMHLIRNAIEHVRDCSDVADKKVKVDVFNEKDTVVVKINNRGEPVSQERLATFFEKFNMDMHRPKKKRMGLGTAYVYIVTRAHGGDIWVESSHKEGTTVTLSFPLSVLPAAEG
ncbi:MAG: PAS domain S-box protein [Candidatus Latescibacterota bacterium]